MQLLGWYSEARHRSQRTLRPISCCKCHSAIVERCELFAFTWNQVRCLSHGLICLGCATQRKTWCGCPCLLLTVLYSHRDLKPENMCYVDERKTTIKLIDFGFSKQVGINQIKSFAMVGTYDYIGMCNDKLVATHDTKLSSHPTLIFFCFIKRRKCWLVRSTTISRLICGVAVELRTSCMCGVGWHVIVCFSQLRFYL